MLPPALALWVLLAGPAPRVADKIVATVNLHAITQYALTARMKAFDQQKPPLDAAQRAQTLKLTLDEMIEELLIADDASHLHLETTDAEIDRAVDQVAAQNHLTREELWKVAKEQGLEKDDYREMLRQKLTELRWLQFKVATMSRPDGGNPLEWMASQRAALVAKLKTDAVIEVRQ